MSTSNINNQVERKKVKSTLEDFNLQVLLFETRKSIIWIILMLIFAAIIAFLYLRHTPDIYKSTSTLMRKTVKQTQLLGVEDLFEEDKSEIDIEIQLLKSKLVVAEAIKDLPLETEYYTKGKSAKQLYIKMYHFEAKLSNLNTQLFDNELELTLGIMM
ncbi:MAG: Wzz/FepE/Etk N-terminal domain-containing protein [Chitinophagales bacterium]